MPETKKQKKIFRSIVKFYKGKPVPEKWQKRYGTKYQKKEAEEIAYAIMKSKGMII